MGQSSHYGRDQRLLNRQNNVDTMAEQYIPAIKKMLLFERASTDEIKAGIETIEKLVRNNKKVTAHQIRNIFTLIHNLEKDTAAEKLNELNLLRPKLAYIGARQKEDDGKIIIRVLDEIIKSIDLREGNDNVRNKIKGLHYIMESIVAYHKFHSIN